MHFKIAFRNTLRNKRRTALSVVMIAGGVCAVLLFRGFAHKVIRDLRDVTIRMQTGNLQIATKSYWDKSERNPKDALLDDAAAITAELKKNPHVKYASGRISFFGLISQADTTLSVHGITVDPAAERDRLSSFRIGEGISLVPEREFEILIGGGLAKRLNAKPGDSVTVLTYTYDGVVNALDMQVAGTFHTSVSEFDDSTFVIPLSTAQRLLDTVKVEQIAVGLDDTELSEALTAQLNTQLKTSHPEVLVKSWLELAKYYQQVVSFFHTQNRVIEVIILSLLLLGILNTVGMSVFERAGEIGTVRALGETRGTVLVQFIVEGAILGAMGCVAGVIAGTLLAYVISAMKVPLVLPGASRPVTVSISLFFAAYRDAILLSLLAAVIAAIVPALRAARMNIVEALRHNI